MTISVSTSDDFLAEDLAASDEQAAPSAKSVGHRALTSSYWILGMRVAYQVLNMVKLLVLARVLSPDDFGIMGIALLTISIVANSTETGLEQALIQRKGDIKPYLNTAWTMLVTRGIFIFALLWVGGPFAASFFNAPEARDIVRAIGAAMFIEGLANIAIVKFKRELDFRQQVAYELSGTVTDVVVSIGASIALRSVWGLVIGKMAASFVQTAVSYLVYPYRPKFDMDWGRVKELLHFGKWILGSTILVFLLTQGDDMLVGRVLGALALGFYQMAYRIACLPATEITSMISTVTFPAYSKMQDDVPRLRSAYARVMLLTSVVSFALAAGVFAIAYDSVLLFMGEKWLPMVGSMQVLVWWGVLRGMNSSQSPVFMAIGKPKIVTWLQAAQAVALYAVIFPFMERWDILGASWAVLGSALLLFFVRNQMLVRTLEWDSWSFYLRLLVPGVVAVMSIATTAAVRAVLPHPITFWSWGVMVAAFLVSYAVGTLLADRVFKMESVALVRTAVLRKA